MLHVPRGGQLIHPVVLLGSEREDCRRTIGKRQVAGLSRHRPELHPLWQWDGQGDETTVAVRLAQPDVGIDAAFGRAQVLLGKGRLLRDVKEPKERALLLDARFLAQCRTSLEEPRQARVAFGVLSCPVQAQLLQEADPLLGHREEVSPGVALKVEGDSEEPTVAQGVHEETEAVGQVGRGHEARGDGLEASLEAVTLPVVTDGPVQGAAVDQGSYLSEGRSVLLVQRPCVHVRASE